MNNTNAPSNSGNRAFSLLELLAVVAVIGVLAGAGFFVTSKIKASAIEQKLQSELSTLNSAVASYLAFGGKLDDADTAEAVFERLRSAAASSIADRIPGLSSAMIDPRMTAVYQTAEEGASKQLRAVWNPGARAFVTARSGDTGIRTFFLADEARPASEEDLRVLSMLYAEKDTWIWDYNEKAAESTSGPTIVSTSTLPPNNSDPTPNDSFDPPIDNPSAKTLSAPAFSIASGEFEFDSFDLPLALTNPNPDGSSDIYYSVDFGNWNLYTPGSEINVGPDQSISAQAIAKTQDWQDSSRVDNDYSVIPSQLLAPTILTSNSSFGAVSNRLVGLILQNPNPEEDSRLQYRINDGAWIDYAQYLLLDRAEFPGGAQISARVLPMTSYFEPSETTSRILAADPLSLTGDSSGTFSNPLGDVNLVSNLAPGLSNSYFEWGKTTNPAGNVINGRSKSTLEFTGATSFNSGLGDSFYVGSLNYKNGTTQMNTNATNIDLNLDLNFGLAGLQHGAGFQFDLDIETTQNTHDAWESADFVAFDQANSFSLFEIDGSTFEISLTFGETTAEGFATSDSFHVFEDGTASANVYATLFDRTISRGNVNADGTLNGGGITPAGLEQTANENGGWWSNLWSWLSGLWS